MMKQLNMLQVAAQNAEHVAAVLNEVNRFMEEDSKSIALFLSIHLEHNSHQAL